MINILFNESFENQIDIPAIESTVSFVLRRQEIDEESDVSVVFEDDDHLQELNRQFLDVDSPTDVLSFPSDETDPDSGHHYLGDIIISVPTAARQAVRANHPLQNEIHLLLTHGLLHLLGFDHSEPQQKKEMWQLQASYLNDLGITINQLPEE